MTGIQGTCSQKISKQKALQIYYAHWKVRELK